MHINFKHVTTGTIGVITLEQFQNCIIDSASILGQQNTAPGTVDNTGNDTDIIQYLTTEKIYFNSYTADTQKAKIYIAPPLPGDMHIINIDSNSQYAALGNVIAFDPSVSITPTWKQKFNPPKVFQKIKGNYFLKAEGQGDILISAFSGIEIIELHANEEFTAAGGAVVAFDSDFIEDNRLSITKGTQSHKVFIKSDTINFTFSGPGKIILQTRNFSSYIAALAPYLNRS